MKDSNEEWPSRRAFLKALGISGVAPAVAGVSSATPGRSPGRKEREVLVGVPGGSGGVQYCVEKYVPDNASVKHVNETLRYAVVKFEHPSRRDMRRFINNAREQSDIKYAEMNETLKASYVPNDLMFGDQYAPQMVNADDAWDTTLGSSSATIAVVDTGVQYDHGDLDGNFGSDKGHDFVDNDSNPSPDSLTREYHGTHVSGIAAGETDNGAGIAGISNSKLLSARALDESGSGSTSDVADAIQWAADQGADVINLSLGGPHTSTLKNAVSYAKNNGSLLVAAAGNNSSNSIDYPAEYPECVAVSALDPDGTLAGYSNRGEEIELCAPGTNVLSTTTTARGDYEQLSGTSMAAPVVSGVAGLAVDKWGLSGDLLRTHLRHTAADVGLSRNAQGYGRVDADAAVANHSINGNDPTSAVESITTSIDDHLEAYWDSDCFAYAWELDDPTSVTVDLDGPSDADFDLYIAEDDECPTTDEYDFVSRGTTSQESITIDGPGTSKKLSVLVDSYSGSGRYTLTVTEKSIQS